MSSLILTFASLNVSYIFIYSYYVFHNYLDEFLILEPQGSMFAVSYLWIALCGDLALEAATDLL